MKSSPSYEDYMDNVMNDSDTEFITEEPLPNDNDKTSDKPLIPDANVHVIKGKQKATKSVKEN